MPELISDGAEFSCNFCASRLKLQVISSSATGDSKELANETNCFLPPPGGNCTFPPGAPPTPCPGIPPGMCVSANQSKVTIDGQTALGTGCKFMCLKGQVVTQETPGQNVVTHDEADAEWTVEKILELVADGLMAAAAAQAIIEAIFPPSEIAAAGTAAVGIGAKGLAKGLKAMRKLGGKKTVSTSPKNSLKASSSHETVGNFKYTKTSGNHVNDVVTRGKYKGELSRPYLKSPHTVNEIMQGGKPIPDPGGVPGALRWDVPGTFRGSKGTWELVLDPEKNVIYRFVFK